VIGPLIDTHCHLNHADLASDWRAIVERAKAAGVGRMIVVGCDISSSEAAVRMAGESPGVFAAVGVHPHEASGYGDTTTDELSSLLACSRVVALGEIGLDFHYDLSPRDAQIRAFRAQLALARAHGAPVIVHCRDAYDETLAALEEARVAGVVHCWTGTAEQAERAVALGLYLGFTGIVTFKRAEQVRGAARIVPEDRLLVETDAPYLAPVPHRGERNEPAFLPLIVRALAAVRDAEPGKIAVESTANAERLFGLTAS
jgi:TatD DNase family protein